MDDKEKDLFIKSELQKDDLISKKADDLFNDFLKGEIKVEEKQENVVKLNQKTKQTLPLRKRILSMVASLVIIFLAANGYAATKGYNNIFFIIKNMFEKENVFATKEEILVDRDITISYKDIEIADGLFIQINSLVVENNNAKLYLSITENGNSVELGKIIVKDVTNDGELLASHKIDTTKNTNDRVAYQEVINLKGMKDNTNVLSLNVLDDKNESISLMEIDLENKEINVLTGKSKGEVQRLSETELKKVLGDFATLVVIGSDDKENELKENELSLVDSLIMNKENNYSSEIIFSKDKVLKAFEELTGERIVNPEDILGDSSFMDYDSKKEEFVFNDNGRDGFIPYVVLSIKDLNYSNGIYSADVIFIMPSEGDYIDNTLEELDQYEMKIDFKLNSIYEYTRYQIVNADKLNYSLYFGNEISHIIEVNNEINDNIPTENTISNTLSDKIDEANTTKTNTTKTDNNTNTNNNDKIVLFGQRADLVDGMLVTVEKIEFLNNKKANLYINVIEEEKVSPDKRIKKIDTSYTSPSLGATTIGTSVNNNSREFNLVIELYEIKDDVSTIILSLQCNKGLIAEIGVHVNENNISVNYANDLLNVDDVDGLESEIKNIVSKYILMNYYKDTDNNNSIEAKREMMLYTAFLLDEDGMYRNYGSESKLTNIGESIVYSIIKGYAGLSFDSNTKFTQNFMTRESGSNGMEGSITYISGKRYNLEANIKKVENFEKLGSFNYRMTFTYSYNLKPNNTYRATIDLQTYEYDPSNPIAKQFVQYKLLNPEIASEKVN